VVGRIRSLTVAVWLWSLTASRSYRGLLADNLAVVPGISPPTASRSYRGLCPPLSAPRMSYRPAL